ncbi:DUF1349 domain-containing protein [Kitasatospora sp. NPDC001175]|uniref:DUF1349 domain-containing protein n=1 Tax=Kitasatospora sp. NPDC001175 TaxID=3157103 RepID=UPI003CFF4B5C
MNDQRVLDWSEATWLNPPLRTESDGRDLVVTTRDRSDFWRTTHYGFERDNGHALLTGLAVGTAVEVTIRARLDQPYDQAGAMVRVDEQNWIKTGVELTDGLPHLGAVVTRGHSDWSLAPVPEWADRPVTVRVSRGRDAVTIRARCGGEPWRTVRLAPLAGHLTASAGPYCCSPEREGLRVQFSQFTVGPADRALHARLAG